jgi:His/Glu/Gln/Arg/opine family amino acid ABC transporter permease subunit
LAGRPDFGFGRPFSFPAHVASIAGPGYARLLSKRETCAIAAKEIYAVAGEADHSLWLDLAWGAEGWGDEFAYGLALTVQISIAGYAIGLALGFMGAFAKLSGRPWLRFIGESYTTTIRALPELLLILLFYYAGTSALEKLLVYAGVAGEDLQISPFVAAISSLGLIYGAYLTDVLRGGIQAIPSGQVDAARAYGMHAPLRFRRIVFPQMIRFAIPGMSNQWLNITKDSSLVSVIGAYELLSAGRSAATSTKEYIFYYGVTGLVFLSLTIVSMIVLVFIERRANRGVRRACAQNDASLQAFY